MLNARKVAQIKAHQDDQTTSLTEARREWERPSVCQYFDIRRNTQGNEEMVAYVRGIALLRLVLTNKGTAFSYEEREALGLDGLLPSHVSTQEEQIERAYAGFSRQPNNIEKYQFLRGLQERQEILFYALVSNHLVEMMPIIYTPTVGEAVRHFSSLYQNPRGFSVSSKNIHRMDTILDDYPLSDIRLVVATDSSAILGIGDQGYGGLAISIGKLSLYTVGGGVSPFHTMPACLDVGTNRLELLEDPLYLGARQERLVDQPYFEFTDQFVESLSKKWPNVVIQWEDLSKEAAFAVLERYRHKVASFNDDIQGTGAVTLAGVLRACQLKEQSIGEQRFLIYGAGAGGIGVAWAIREGLKQSGLSDDEASKRVLVFDSGGLVLSNRPLPAYKADFAQDESILAEWDFAGDPTSLEDVISAAKVTALIGLSGQAGAFNESVVQAVANNSRRPIVFALSNPNSHCEGNPQDFSDWTDGKAVVATGSPFPDVECSGKKLPVAQGNNAFIFPGLGFGSMLSGATCITDGMVLAAAYALTEYTKKHHAKSFRLYPPLEELRDASLDVAAAVIQRAIQDGVCTKPELESKNLKQHVQEQSWEPDYLPVVCGDNAV